MNTATAALTAARLVVAATASGWTLALHVVLVAVAGALLCAASVMATWHTDEKEKPMKHSEKPTAPRRRPQIVVATGIAAAVASIVLILVVLWAWAYGYASWRVIFAAFLTALVGGMYAAWVDGTK